MSNQNYAIEYVRTIVKRLEQIIERAERERSSGDQVFEYDREIGLRTLAELNGAVMMALELDFHGCYFSIREMQNAAIERFDAVFTTPLAVV